MEKTHQTGSFLSPEQIKTLAEIASGDSTLARQRAQAILLIASGETHMEAAGKTGLTIGQVRYALVRFKKLELSMFGKISSTSDKDDPPPEPVKTQKEKGKKAKRKKVKTKKKESKKTPEKKEKKKKGIKADDSKVKKNKKKKKEKASPKKKKKK